MVTREAVGEPALVRCLWHIAPSFWCLRCWRPFAVAERAAV